MKKKSGLLLVVLLFILLVSCAKDSELTTLSETVNLDNYAQYNKTVVVNGQVVEVAPVESIKEDEYYILQFIGPVEEGWKTALEAQGVVFYDYVPNYAFKVQLPAEKLALFNELRFVESIIVYKEEFKIQADVSERIAQADQDEGVLVNIYVHDGADADDIGALLEDVEMVSYEDSLVIAKVRNEDLADVLSNPKVSYVEDVPQFSVHNDLAAGVLDVSAARNGLALDGSGQVVGIIDTGIDTGVDNLSVTGDIHLDLDNRISDIDIISGCSACTDADDDNGHGTHVSGSVAGNGTLSNGQYAGTAPNSTIVFTSAGDETGSTSIFVSTVSLESALDDAYNNNARIHTNSWGSSVSLGDYNSFSQKVDDFMWDHKDMLIFFSAGNCGSGATGCESSGNNTVSLPGTAKNTLTIGAVESTRNDGNPDEVASFSSRGTTDDGRVKPDLVAPGTSVTSTKSSVTGSDNYETLSGTSMATPLAAGIAALVREDLLENQRASNPSAALVKAVLINGATQIDGHSYPSTQSGWGRINLTNTLLPTGSTYVSFIDNSSGLSTSGSDSYAYEFSGTAALKVTLVWTDDKTSTTNFAGTNLVNDLDLVLVDPNGVEYVGNDFTSPYNDTNDRVNNVENIVIDAPAVGTYTIKVNGFNVPNGPQPYALVVRGGLDVTPSTSSFDGNTTNLTQSSDLKQVSNLVLEKEGTGSISWNNPVYAAGQLLTENIQIGEGFVFVDSASLHGTFNSSAQISISGVSVFSPQILKDGAACSDCSLVSYENGIVTFAVEGFSNYTITEGSSSSLSIWDSADDNLYGNELIFADQTSSIFANYSNITSGIAVDDGSCQATLGNSSVLAMSYNASIGLYAAMTSFAQTGDVNYTVGCSHSTFTDLSVDGTLKVLDSLLFSTDKPENVSIVKNENGSVSLSWNSVANAEEYAIYYDENSTLLRSLDVKSASAQVSGLTGTSYVDTQAVGVRYYLVASVNGTNKNGSDELVGRFDLAIDSTTGSTTTGTQMNLVSLPLTVVNLSVKELLGDRTEHDVVYTFNAAENKTEFLQYLDGEWSGDFSELMYNHSYAFKPNTVAFNVTLVGDVPSGNTSVTIYESSGVAGVGRELNMVGWYSSEQRCDLNVLLSSAANGDTIYRFNRATNQFESITKTSGVWSGDFSCFDPGHGYEFRKVNATYVFEYSQ